MGISNLDNVKGFKAQIDNEMYFFRGLFMNPDASVVPISKPMIKRLIVVDNIFKPFLDATVTITDQDYSFERLNPSTISSDDSPTSDVSGFKYRGDGKDVFVLEIIPLEGDTDPLHKDSETYNSVFGLRNAFICNNDETVDEDGVSYRVFELMDQDESKLNQRKINYSTIESLTTMQELSSVPVINLSNKQREGYTGICIRDILKKGLIKTDEELFYIKGENGLPANFENGSSKLFYSSSAKDYAIDDLTYMYRNHVSDSNGDFSFLKKHNYDGKYTLESVKSIFSRAYIKGDKDNDAAGVYNIERVIISGESSGSDEETKTVKTPSIISSFGEKSKVISYQFFNTPAESYNDKIKTKIVHTYDTTGKSFIMKQKENNIVNAKKIFNDNYASVLKGKDRPYPSFLTTFDKLRNVTYEDVYSLHNDENILKGKGLNELLKDGILTNLGVELTLKGQLFRKSGRFISIERAENYVDTNFDKKFIGIYFILEVNSLIEGNSFINKIVAVKTYFYDDLKYTEEAK